MAGYLGASPVPQTIQKKQSFTATASQTTFTTTGYTDGAFINVYLNGVRLINGTDYTATNGSDIVLTTGASASDVLDFETFNEFTLVDQTLETPTFRTSATLKNDTEEDTDGGRESTLIFKGEQSGGEISTLAQIQASHDGTSDDQKGDLIFKTNDGSDNDAPTERMRIDSSGRLGLGTTAPADNLEIDVAASNTGLLLTDNGDGFFPHIKYDSNRSSAGQGLGKFSYNWNGTEVARIEGAAGTDATNKDDGGMIFYSRTSGSSLAARWEITTDGNFKARANGLGIDFSHTEGSGASSSILNDYEEGTWTPVLIGSGGNPTVTYSVQDGRYTKIGRIVYVEFDITMTAKSGGSGDATIAGLPFTKSNVAPKFSGDMGMLRGGRSTALDSTFRQSNFAGTILGNDTAIELSYTNTSGGASTYNVVTGIGTGRIVGSMQYVV